MKLKPRGPLLRSALFQAMVLHTHGFLHNWNACRRFWSHHPFPPLKFQGQVPSREQVERLEAGGGVGWEDGGPLGQTQSHRPTLATASLGLGLSSLVAKVRPDQGCDLHCREFGSWRGHRWPWPTYLCVKGSVGWGGTYGSRSFILIYRIPGPDFSHLISQFITRCFDVDYHKHFLNKAGCNT